MAKGITREVCGLCGRVYRVGFSTCNFRPDECPFESTTPPELPAKEREPNRARKPAAKASGAAKTRRKSTAAKAK